MPILISEWRGRAADFVVSRWPVAGAAAGLCCTLFVLTLALTRRRASRQLGFGVGVDRLTAPYRRRLVHAVFAAPRVVRVYGSIESHLLHSMLLLEGASGR